MILKIQTNNIPLTDTMANGYFPRTQNNGKFGAFILSGVVEYACYEIRKIYHLKMREERIEDTSQRAQRIDELIKDLQKSEQTDAIAKQIRGLKQLRKHKAKISPQRSQEIRSEVIESVASKRGISATHLSNVIGERVWGLNEEAHEDIS